MPTIRRNTVEEASELVALAATITTLKTCRDRKQKESLLEDTFRRSPFLKKWFRLAYDPLKQFRFNTLTGYERLEPGDSILHVLEESAAGRMGPELAASRFAHRCLKCSGPAADAARKVLNKDLQCGLTVQSLNRVYSRLGNRTVLVFDVPTATPWTRKKVWKYGTWYGSEELVGARCVTVITETGDPSMHRPDGTGIWQLEELRTELAINRPRALGDLVLDGKVALDVGESLNFLALDDPPLGPFPYQWTRVVYLVYDIYTLKEFDTGEGTRPYSERRAFLNQYLTAFNRELIRAVPQKRIESSLTFRRLLDRATERNWLGVVLREDAPYESGPTSYLQIVDTDEQST